MLYKYPPTSKYYFKEKITLRYVRSTVVTVGDKGMARKKNPALEKANRQGI